MLQNKNNITLQKAHNNALQLFAQRQKAGQRVRVISEFQDQRQTEAQQQALKEAELRLQAQIEAQANAKTRALVLAQTQVQDEAKKQMKLDAQHKAIQRQTEAQEQALKEAELRLQAQIEAQANAKTRALVIAQAQVQDAAKKQMELEEQQKAIQRQAAAQEQALKEAELRLQSQIELQASIKTSALVLAQAQVENEMKKQMQLEEQQKTAQRMRVNAEFNLQQQAKLKEQMKLEAQQAAQKKMELEAQQAAEKQEQAKAEFYAKQKALFELKKQAYEKKQAEAEQQAQEQERKQAELRLRAQEQAQKQAELRLRAQEQAQKQADLRLQAQEQAQLERKLRIQARLEVKKQAQEKLAQEKLAQEKQVQEKLAQEKQVQEKRRELHRQSEEQTQEKHRELRLRAEQQVKEMQAREKHVQAREKHVQEKHVQEKQVQEKQVQEKQTISIDIFTSPFIENIANALATILTASGIKCNVYIRNLTNVDIAHCRKTPTHYLFIFCPQFLLQAQTRATYPIGLDPLPVNKYYLYQFEQLDTGNLKNMNSNIKKLIQHAKHTFDYSEINLPYYPDVLRNKVSILPPPVVHMPIMPNTPLIKKYDVLFVGTLTPRRALILAELKAAGYIVHTPPAYVFGVNLTELIQEAHIVLNIHHSTSDVLETCRLNEAVLSPDTHIISEKSSDPAAHLYAGRVHFVETTELVNTIKDILTNSPPIEPFTVNTTTENIKLHINTYINTYIFNKLALLFHVGNINIANIMIIDYPNLFNNDDTDLYISCHSIDIYNNLKNIIKIKKYIICENIGRDIGGFFNIMWYFKKHKLNKLYKKYLFIHTKTDNNWRNKLIKPIYKNLNKIRNDTEINRPIIYSSIDNCEKNNKCINKCYIEDNLSHYKDKLNNYRDEYYDDDIYTYNNPNKINIYSCLDINSNFYKYYECNNNQYINDEYMRNMWFKHGQHEFHRITNIHYIKNSSKYKTYFVAGTIFACNSQYFDLLLAYDLEEEISKLERNDFINDIPRRTHSWEYTFGYLLYLNDGYIVDLIDNKKYITKENTEIMPKVSVINIPFLKSKIAFFMLPIDNIPNSGGYRTLLKYIKYLNDSGYNVDIYFGISWTTTELNLNTLPSGQYGIPSCENWKNHRSLQTLIDNINNYNEIDIKKNNYYIGFHLQRNYDILVANAWQVSEAVYSQKNKSKHITYIIQDREELFYNNELLKKNVLNTYQPEYNYYCLSKYLSIYFKNMFVRGNVKITNSVLGFDNTNYFIKNMTNTREKSIVIAYYKEKLGRLPHLVEKIINILSKKYKCYIFPDKYNKSINQNIINCGTLNVSQLNDLYNTNKIGIIFSNTNPSRLGFEMAGSGLNVIEYESEFTKHDLDPNYFTLIKNEINIMNIIDTLMEKEIDLNSYENYKKLNNTLMEKQIICDFFNNLLYNCNI